jgi:hypothetical protein
MALSKEQYSYAAAALVATAVAGYAIYSYMGEPSAAKKPSGFKDEGTESLRTLYKSDANKRAKMIKDVSYRVAYALIRGGQTFHG